MKKALLILFQFFAFSGCSMLGFYRLPPNFVPDKEVVYLKQNLEYGPIPYPAVETSPYQFITAPYTNKVVPDYKAATDIALFEIPDIRADATYLRDIKKDLYTASDSEIFRRLRTRLEAAPTVPPAKREQVTGELVKEYGNGKEYSYPPVPGATITLLNNGDVIISLPDKNTYYAKPDGRYFEETPDKKELYAVFTAPPSFRMMKDGILYSRMPESLLVQTNTSSLLFLNEKTGNPQYQFKNDSENHTFFLDSQMRIYQTAFENRSGIRFDHIKESDSILITKGNKAVQIFPDLKKTGSAFNFRSHKSTNIHSYFFPDGVRISGLDSPPSVAHVKPAWPENYSPQRMGPYLFLVTSSNKADLAQIKPATLDQLNLHIRNTLGETVSSDRPIILPPNLESYRKLHAFDRTETLNWYPAGFATRGLVIMWPFSVPKYATSDGVTFFFEHEFYEILIHELVHVKVAEMAGILSPVPVWLNEGLALFVESSYSPQTKEYWDTTALGYRTMKKSLDWDEITVRSTGEYPIATARLHYAQSYAMVRFMIRQYGQHKVMAYVRSFHRPLDENLEREEELSAKMRKGFEKIFGKTWEENLLAYEASLEEKPIASDDR